MRSALVFLHRRGLKRCMQTIRSTNCEVVPSETISINNSRRTPPRPSIVPQEVIRRPDEKTNKTQGAYYLHGGNITDFQAQLIRVIYGLTLERAIETPILLLPGSKERKWKSIPCALVKESISKKTKFINFREGNKFEATLAKHISIEFP